jgi:hypothetical protein
LVRLLCRLLLLRRKLLLLCLGCCLLPQLLRLSRGLLPVARLCLPLCDGLLRLSKALLLCSDSCLTLTPDRVDV